MLSVYHLGLSAQGPSTHEKLESSEVGKVVSNSIMVHKRIPSCSVHVLVLGRVEAEYVEVMSILVTHMKESKRNNPQAHKYR